MTHSQQHCTASRQKLLNKLNLGPFPELEITSPSADMLILEFQVLVQSSKFKFKLKKGTN